MDRLSYEAAMKGHFDTIIRCADGRPLSQIRTPFGNSYLHVYMASEDTEKPQDSNDFIENMVAHDENLLATRNKDEELLHHVAARYGQCNALKCVLDCGGDQYTSFVDKEGNNVLHLAVRGKHTTTVEMLMKVSNPDHMDIFNKAEETPLLLAVKDESIEIVSMICQAIPEAKHGSKKAGFTLHVAVRLQNVGLVETLLNLNNDLIKAQDAEMKTPVHYAAAQTMNIVILNILLRNASQDTVDMQDELGQTAVLIAAQSNNVAAVKLLLQISPHCFEIVDNANRNPCHYAAVKGHGEALRYFSENTNYCFGNLHYKKDNGGNTPLHLLASSLPKLSMQSAKYISQNVMPLLKEVNLKETNNESFTPGDIADRHNINDLTQHHLKIVSQLRIKTTGLRIKDKVIPHSERETALEDKKRLGSELKKTANKHFAVAALIGTMSFAISVAVPGGFNQNEKDTINGGTAMLGKKPAFQAFLICNAVSLTTSVFAVVCYFLIALGDGRGIAKKLFHVGFISTSTSIIALMVAFMASIFCIEYRPIWVIVLILMIASTITIFCILLFIPFLASMKTSKPDKCRA